LNIFYFFWLLPSHLSLGPSLVLNGSKASCGGVLRNCFGAWISGFLRNIGTTYVLSAELWGIFSTLDISWRVGHRRVLVECDSKVTAKLMSKGCLSSHPYSPLIHSIQRFFSRSWVLRVNHVYRKRNAVADSLAALAHSKPIGLFLLQSHPPLCSSLLLKDLVAGPIVRAVAFVALVMWSLLGVNRLVQVKESNDVTFKYER